MKMTYTTEMEHANIKETFPIGATPESTSFDISENQYRVKIDWKDGTLTNWYCEAVPHGILLQNPRSGYFICQSEFKGVGINAIWKDGEKIWKA